jgi:hypothetical protein
VESYVIRDQWRVLMGMVMNVRVPKIDEIFLPSLATIGFSSRTLLSAVKLKL